MPRQRSEKTKAGDQAYRDAHRGEAKARAKAWAKANPEKRREAERLYREKNRAKIAAQKRLWRAKNRDKHRAANARWKMKRRISLEGYQALLASQEGKCAICRSPDMGRTKSGRFAIDHCHTTGRVRGLLCHRCNTMLGQAKDNVETLRRAIAYLEVNALNCEGGGAVCTS